VTTESSQKGAERSAECFECFYRDHYRAVLAYCRRRLTPQAAEDAAAGVFTAAWRKWPSVPRGGGALPWLYGAARREVLHQWRSAARYRRLLDRIRRLGRPDPARPDHVVVQGVEAELARQALAQLRPGDQELLRLELWEGLSHREVGAVLGITEKAARTRLWRATRRLGDAYRSLERHHVTSPSRLERGGGR
jgi:RNA polymerase sigma-70 factor (ECF subfamily)